MLNNAIWRCWNWNWKDEISSMGLWDDFQAGLNVDHRDVE